MAEIRYIVADGICEITLSNPQRLNAFDKAALEQFVHLFEALESEQGVRAIIITGDGRAFCSGADFAGDISTGAPITAERMRGGINRAILAIRNSRLPVVMAVNGVAAGGGVGLALAGDIVLASSDAYFFLSFANVGLSLDCGASLFVQQAIGVPRARALALLGDRLPASQACDWGLVWQVYDGEILLEEARMIARRLAEGPPLALASIKRAMEVSASATLDEALENEIALQAEAFRTDDLREGVRAFREKRRPNFTGR